MTLLERFESKYIPEPNSGCWLWIGGGLGSSSLPNRYGSVFLSNKPHRVEAAHRVSYKLHRGDIPDGLHVLHRCDMPCCVNPEHLFLGTTADNNKDMVSKGRNGAARGTRHGSAKLTDDIVREIRRAPGTLQQLARRFGVHLATISDIKRGTTWSHVN